MNVSRIERTWTRASMMAATTLAAFTAGCDPCAGVSTCTAAPVISYLGAVVDGDGLPVSDADVTFERLDGVQLGEDVFGGTTDASGRFTIEQPASRSGVVQLAVTVETADAASYRATGLELKTLRAGDTRSMGSLRSRPYVSYLLEVYLRGTGQPLASAAMDFQRTGGAPAPQDPEPVVTSPTGHAWIETETGGSGELIGDLSVVPAGMEDPLQVTGLRLPTFFRAGESRLVRVGVGPSLAYGGRILLPGATAGADDLLVAFQRTGGIELVQDSFEVRTDQNGLFPLFLSARDPFAAGEVSGRLHIHVEGPYRPIDPGELRVTTFDDDGVRLLQEWVLEPV